MRTNKIVVVLLALTIGMQIVIFYRQSRGPSVGQARQQPPPVRDADRGTVIELRGLPTQGSSRARVALIEFSDYECPYCARYSTTVLKDIRKEFVESGKLQYAFANNPLPIHGNARSLAIAALCAGQQDRYWEMHDKLFETTPKSKDAVREIAAGLGIDMKSFGECSDQSAASEKRIDGDIAKARTFQLLGTPGFAIGIVDSRGQVQIQKFVMGAQPLEVFQSAIKEVLNRVS